MSHVRIKTGAQFSISVDGIDITKHVLAEGFRVELPTLPNEPAKVYLALAADDLELALVEAAINLDRRLCDPGVAAAVRSLGDLPDRIADAINRGARNKKNAPRGER